MNKMKKGFTLIELLVVIAIIGILAALVLVALGNARTKAQDARVKSNLSQLRTLAEVHYDDNGSSYTTFDTCVTTPNDTNCQGGIENSVNALISDMSSIANVTLDVQVNSTGTEACMSANHASDSASYFCTDTSGAFTDTTDTCQDTGLCGASGG